MRNRFSGYCYFCTKHVPVGAGHFEKRQDAKGFRVIHADCIFKQREIKLEKCESVVKK